MGIARNTRESLLLPLMDITAVLDNRWDRQAVLKVVPL